MDLAAAAKSSTPRLILIDHQMTAGRCDSRTGGEVAPAGDLWDMSCNVPCPPVRLSGQLCEVRSAALLLVASPVSRTAGVQ